MLQNAIKDISKHWNKRTIRFVITVPKLLIKYAFIMFVNKRTLEIFFTSFIFHKKRNNIVTHFVKKKDDRWSNILVHNSPSILKGINYLKNKWQSSKPLYLLSQCRNKFMHSWISKHLINFILEIKFYINRAWKIHY